MRKNFCLVLALSLVLLACFGCSSASHNGEYREYYINDELVTRYYSITLRNGKFSLSDVRVVVEETTTTFMCSGKYSVNDDGEITFTESNGNSFSGTIDSTRLNFTRNYIMYSMKKQ